ncbi:hypothetical protein Taro_012304 [Colocasia esculenta]|uniref:Uncharacterized protein n=1 Tax=Colocasia esculenta TaxID=4460 RepID=A0A843U3N7_COLES|nr:hypothetical protein [Colocasia esculenta]
MFSERISHACRQYLPFSCYSVYISDKTYLYNVGHKIQDIKIFLWRVPKDKRLKIRSFLADLSNVKEDQLWLGVRIREGDSTLDSEILRYCSGTGRRSPVERSSEPG